MAIHDRRAVGARVVVSQTTRLLRSSRLGALSGRMGAQLPQRASRWVRSRPAIKPLYRDARHPNTVWAEESREQRAESGEAGLVQTLGGGDSGGS
jgi:hypothetical protein